VGNFLNEKYTMHSYKCECFIDTVHNPDGSLHTTLRARALSAMPLLFAYMPQDGLVRINRETGAIESKNLLGELMGIRDGDKDGIMRFFRENGFLFPITFDGLESFSFEDIFSVLRKIRETLNLMSLLHEPRIQYKKIMSTLCWLTLSRRVHIRSLDESREEFKTCLHSYIKYLESQQRGIYDSLSLDPYASNDIVVPDTVYPPETSVSISDLERAALVGDADSGLSRYRASILFLSERGEIPSDRKVIDYFYHLTTEVGNIMSVQESKAEISFDCGDAEVAARFSTQLRRATIDVAKITIKEELDYAINAIFPSYDIDAMTGSWVIPDLYSALLFSIFYMKPDLELYRKCENPNCGCYFLVSTTNSRRKYCSIECSNAMQQRKHRQKIKKASTAVDAGS